MKTVTLNFFEQKDWNFFVDKYYTGDDRTDALCGFVRGLNDLEFSTGFDENAPKDTMNFDQFYDTLGDYFSGIDSQELIEDLIYYQKNWISGG